MEKNNTQQVKDLISRLVATASIVDSNIENNTENTIWPYAKSLNSRLRNICTTVLGPDNNMSVVDMLSALFTIERDVVLSGWTDDITGVIVKALTFENDFNKNESIAMYLFDLAAFVGHTFELKSYIESCKDEDIVSLKDEFNKVLNTIEHITNACKNEEC